MAIFAWEVKPHYNYFLTTLLPLPRKLDTFYFAIQLKNCVPLLIVSEKIAYTNLFHDMIFLSITTNFLYKIIENKIIQY